MLLLHLVVLALGAYLAMLCLLAGGLALVPALVRGLDYYSHTVFEITTDKLGAQGTVALLNEYFTLMVDCIQREEGMLDKFIGDAIMAFWGAPRAPLSPALMHWQQRSRASVMTRPA